MKSVISRGRTLEEGVVNFFAQEYAKKKWSENLGIDNLSDTQDMDMGVFLHLRIARVYSDSTFLVRRMIEDGGEEMKQLLLSARVDGSKTRKLIDKINQIYESDFCDEVFEGAKSKSVAGRLFATGFDETAVGRFLIELEFRGKYVKWLGDFARERLAVWRKKNKVEPLVELNENQWSEFREYMHGQLSSVYKSDASKVKRATTKWVQFVRGEGKPQDIENYIIDYNTALIKLVDEKNQKK